MSYSLAAVALVLTACGGARPRAQTAPPGAVAPPAPPQAIEVAVIVSTGPVANVVPSEPTPAVAPDANLVLIVSEAVSGPSEDLGSYTKVYVAGSLAGQTQAAAKSVQKRWSARIEVGNYPVRLEKWDLPIYGDWAALDGQWQPNERFIRIKPDQRTTVRLKFFDGGRGHSLEVEYGALGALP